MKKHFTATALIIHDNQVLLLFHKKLGSWLPPGGHLEDNELPHECAIRETKEETGLNIEIISSRIEKIVGDEIAWELPRPAFIQAWEIPRPQFMLEEVIPENKKEEEHRHIDHVYLAKPLHTNLHPQEGHKLKWFTLEEIKNLPDEEIFENCKQICLTALQQN